MDNYSNSDATFASTREAKFLLQIMEAVEQGDSEAYVAAVQEFDRFMKLVRFVTPLFVFVHDFRH